MTFDHDRHDLFEELISASLSGELGEDERARLDAHLDGCDRCRATLAAFADQRRIVAGLRHVAPPRDLSARVRTGIQRGATGVVPWWRRPPAIFAGVGGALAAVAGAMLALVLLNGPAEEDPIGQPSSTPSAPTVIASRTATPAAATPVTTPIATPVATVTASPAPTLPPVVTPVPSGPAATDQATPAPTPVAPSATPVEASPEPDSYVAVSGPFDNLAVTIRDGATGETQLEVEATPGAVIAAELSPDGQWLSFITELGQSGMTATWATRVAAADEITDPDEAPAVESDVPVGDTVALGEGIAAGPFVRHLAWSSDSRYLAYTLVDPESGATDAWILDASSGEASQATDVGNAHAASWVPGADDTSLLWISTAGETPRSYLRVIDPEAGSITAVDPADSPFPPAEDVFQPLVSPNGAFVIYWTGRMEPMGPEWQFTERGAPWLAQNTADGELGFRFTSSRPLFSDLDVEEDAFSSAAIAWGIDSDAYAAWDVRWTGPAEQAWDGGEYPDQRRVYFSRATDSRGITDNHALDRADLPEDATVVDVKPAPTGRHLAITVRLPLPGDLSEPDADLLLVTRNTGDVPDDVVSLRGERTGWFGPATYARDAWLERLGR